MEIGIFWTIFTQKRDKLSHFKAIIFVTIRYNLSDRFSVDKLPLVLEYIAK